MRLRYLLDNRRALGKGLDSSSVATHEYSPWRNVYVQNRTGVNHRLEEADAKDMLGPHRWRSAPRIYSVG
jgi:hypothetical protein